MKQCKKCLLNKNYPNISFNDEGICSFCSSESKSAHSPIGEDILVSIFEAVKNKNKEYDALVPLSGGKDSTYILYLATKIYNLKVITMTYDNGFLSDTAKNNINYATKQLNVKHVYYKPNTEIQQKVLRNSFKLSGDICGACDIGTKASIFKFAREYKTGLILFGTSPLEEDSFVPDNIQDINRLKYILQESGELTQKEINEFLIYPNFNNLKESIYKKLGIIPKIIKPLFYIKNPTDKEVGKILKKELNWTEEGNGEYTKHFDCIAEPLTNYVRNKIYGYERHLCQYSNMIRNNEINKEKAIEMYKADDINTPPKNYKEILDYLEISKKELNEKILTIKPFKYKSKTTFANKLFYLLMKLKH